MRGYQTMIRLCLVRPCRSFVISALTCFFLMAPAPVRAQFPLNTNGASPESAPQQAAQQPVENIDDAIARLQELLIDARQKLRSAQDSPESAAPEQLAVTADEMQSKLSMLYERVRIYQQHIEAYKALKETRSAGKNLSLEIESWKGFEQTPPYPMSLVDELRGAIYAQNLKIKKEEVKQSMADAELADARLLMKAAEQRLRKVQEGLEKPSGTADQVRLQWLYNLALLETTVAKAKALGAETQRLAFNETLAYYRQSLAFLDRKLQIALSDALLSKEEYDATLAAIALERKATEKTLRETIREELLAREQLEEARQALTLARESLKGEAQLAPEKTGEMDRLQKTLDMRTAWSETWSQIVEGLEFSLYEFNTEEMVWEKRYRLAQGQDESELNTFLKEADKKLEELRGRHSYFQSNLELTRSLVTSQQNRIAALDAANGDKDLGRQTLEAYTRRVAFHWSTLARFEKLIQLLEHWRSEIVERRQHIPITERFRTFSATASKVAESIWDYELFSAEDTIIIDGQPITERRPVTVSKVIRALLILAIGLWLSAVFARRMRATSVKHFRVEQAGADLIEKTFRSVIIVCVVFFALVTVKIPLTVFAFLGGALAIGVGFGAQNLINNFISGIILLFERPIRVGDIVEIDGTRGKVTNIGARCSEIRCFGGVDMLVPNSTFLEKNVVNWTLSDNLLRLSVTVGVAYGSPTDDVSRLITEALNEHKRILRFPEPVILFEDFGDSSLVFTVYFWIEISSQLDFRIIASDLRHILDKRLREAGITIAFPQRDVHFDHPRPIQVQIIDKQELKNPEDYTPDSS